MGSWITIITTAAPVKVLQRLHGSCIFLLGLRTSVTFRSPFIQQIDFLKDTQLKSDYHSKYISSKEVGLPTSMVIHVTLFGTMSSGWCSSYLYTHISAKALIQERLFSAPLVIFVEQKSFSGFSDKLLKKMLLKVTLILKDTINERT